MKKRLLITSELMTAVLGASLATGTYAWYQAASGSVGAATNSGTIQTSASDHSINGVELGVSYSSIPTLALTDTDGNAWVYDAGETKVTYNGSNAKYTAVTITVGNEDENYSAIAGTYTVTVSATGAARVALEVGDVYDEEDNDKVEFTVVINQYGIGTTALSQGNASDTVALTFYVSVAGADSVEATVSAGLVTSIAAA